MRVFLAGATGVIGVRLVPLLTAAGHEVAGVTRTPGKAGLLEDLGAEPVVCDVYDLDALTRGLVAFRPDAVLDELTDLPDDPAHLQELGAANSRIRREGTHNLLTAAGTAGVARFVSQSVAWPLPGDGGVAVEDHERMILAADGVVVRYGRLYGPGTYYPGSELPEPPRVHVDDAAGRTLPTLTGPSRIVTIVEDAPRG